MNIFQVGDKVRYLGLSNEAHQKEYGNRRLLSLSKVWREAQLVSQSVVDDWPTQAETTPKLVDAPNAAMIEADEDAKKKGKFYAIVRNRKRDRLIDKLGDEKDCSEIAEIGKKYWAAIHLTNAIEKTLNRAEHPQAMWSI